MIISTFMLIALGFLTATLIVLFTVPLIWRWAVRLTTRRMEKKQRKSLAGRNGLETNVAEVRADYSQNTRKVEKRLEELKQKLAAEAVETARHNAAVNEFEETINDKDRELAERDAEIQKRIDAAVQLEAELAARSEVADRLRDDLRERDETQQALQGDLLEAQKSITLRGEKIAELKETLEALESRVEPVERQNAASAQAIEHKDKALDDLQQLVADQKNKLFLQQTKIDEVDQVVAGKDAEIERLVTTAKAQTETLEAQGLTAQKAKDVAALSNAVIDKLRSTNSSSEETLKHQAKAIVESERTAKAQATEITKLKAALETHETRLVAQAEAIEAANALVTQKDTELKRLNSDLKVQQASTQKSDKTVISVSETVRQKDDEIARLRQSATSREDQMAELSANLDSARKELAGRVKDAERMSGQLAKHDTALRQRETTLAILKDELASLTAKSAEESELFKAQVSVLEDDRQRLRAELDKAGRDTDKLLHQFDELDQMWETRLDGSASAPAQVKNGVSRPPCASGAKPDDEQQDDATLTDRFRALQNKIA